jgi:hypothetical protein
MKDLTFAEYLLGRIDDGPKDIDYVKELLSRIAGVIGDDRASATTANMS